MEIFIWYWDLIFFYSILVRTFNMRSALLAHFINLFFLMFIYSEREREWGRGREGGDRIPGGPYADSREQDAVLKPTNHEIIA